MFVRGPTDDLYWSEMHKMWMYKADNPYYNDHINDEPPSPKAQRRSLLFIVGGLCVGIIQFFSIIR